MRSYCGACAHITRLYTFVASLRHRGISFPEQRKEKQPFSLLLHTAHLRPICQNALSSNLLLLCCHLFIIEALRVRACSQALVCIFLRFIYFFFFCMRDKVDLIMRPGLLRRPNDRLASKFEIRNIV